MPFATNDGVKIHYEVVGQGPDLVLQHGLTVSGKENWVASGWVSELENDFRLIIVDARGHGQSDKPSEQEAYALHLMSQDIVSVLDDLGVEKTSFFGYSMGADIGYSLVKHHVERLKAIILGGAPPFGTTPPASAYMEGLLKRYEIGAEFGAEASIKYIKETLGELHPEMEAIYRQKEQADYLAYIAIIRQYLDHLPNFAETLAAIRIPCLIYGGDKDVFFTQQDFDALGTFPNFDFVALSGLDHIGAIFDLDTVVPLVRGFIKAKEG